MAAPVLPAMLEDTARSVRWRVGCGVSDGAAGRSKALVAIATNGGTTIGA
jgi:hypothetical protein